MKIKIMSVQRVVFEDMFDFEFIGDGCLLPDATKKAILHDLAQSIEFHLKPVTAMREQYMKQS